MFAPTPVRALAAIAALTTAATAAPCPPPRPQPYASVVERVSRMVSDQEVQSLARERGLQLLDLTWEDTGRHQGSSVGPNISDVTIEVVSEDRSARKLALMPVLRFPNFSDRTADVRLEKIWLRVGNERSGGPQQVVSLRDFLAEPARFLSARDGGQIARGTLLAPRDTHALVSAQAAFLPVPPGGQATFHPVIFNYQSTAGHPAVLTLLVTRQGTSLTIVDNARDTVSGRASWGQRLFFNEGGSRAPLTAERLSDVQASGQTMNGESASSLGGDANLLLLVQVPLVIRRPPPSPSAADESKSEALGAAGAPSAMKARRANDMETAVLGHGALDGPFTELAGLQVTRDERFPVRVTVQFYQATATGQIGRPELAKLASLIDAVYTKGDFVGSLVVPGPQDVARPTSWQRHQPVRPPICEYPGLAERYQVDCPPPLPPVGVR